MATADEEAMEGDRGGFGVVGAASPFGAVSVGEEGHGRRFGIFAHHEGRVRGSRESAPRGQGRGQWRRGGGPRPALESTLPSFLSFFLAGCRGVFFFPLFSLIVGGVGGLL